MAIGEGGTWLEQQKGLRSLRDKERFAEASKLLDISPTNRRLTEKQSKYMSVCRMACIGLEAEGWKKEEYQWILDLMDALEEYQLTVGEPINSRDSFLKALIADVIAEKKANQPKLGV